MGDLTDLTVTELARALSDGKTSAVEVARAVIACVSRQASLGAVAAFGPQQLVNAATESDERRRQGRAGPLDGIPLILKDNIDTAQLPTTGGTGALAGSIAPCNAPAAQRLVDAGGLLAAKAVMHELAFGITSNNAVTGPARNPYNPAMIPGGSSGGTASAVASHQFPAGLGTDTGGSVRIPAALCGLFGFRPSVGRYAGDGVLPISHTRDTIGPIARSMADILLLDSCLAGERQSGALAVPLSFATGLRIGVPHTRLWENLEPGVKTLAEKSLSAMSNAGITIVEVDFATDIWDLNDQVGFPVALYEVMRDLPAYLRDRGLDLSMNALLDGVGSPDVKGILESQMGDQAIPEAAYRAALDTHRPQAQALYTAFFDQHNLDAIAFPTTPLVARPVGEDETVTLNGAQVPTFATFIRNTELGSVISAPGITLPIGMSDGLPAGLELEGRIGNDQNLLQLASMVSELFEPLPAPSM